MAHWVGESLILLLCAFGIVGVFYPDNRWSRAISRGYAWDWVIPRWQVRATSFVWAALWGVVAFFLRWGQP